MTSLDIQVNKESAVPLHAQLKECLKSAICNGTLVRGDKLPTEDELCEQLEISRPVVRQAYSDLVKEGFVERIRGKGSFVREHNENGMFLMQLVSFQEEMQVLGKVPGTILLGVERIGYNRDVFTRLGLEPDAGCLHISRVRLADQKPFMHVNNYIPLDLFPGLEDYDFSRESLYHIYEDVYGVKLTRALRDMQAQTIKPFYAHVLGVSVGSPVIVMSSVVYDQYNRAVDYSVDTYPGENHHFYFSVQKD